MIRAECGGRGQIHRGEQAFRDNDIEDIGSDRRVVYWGINHIGILDGSHASLPLDVISLEFQSTCLAFKSPMSTRRLPRLADNSEAKGAGRATLKPSYWPT